MNLDKINAALHGEGRVELEALWQKRAETLGAIETLGAQLVEAHTAHDAVEQEIRELLGIPAQAAQPISVRAKQKCSICGSETHNKRNCDKKE